MSPDKLVYMANQIGKFFAAQDAEKAAPQIDVCLFDSSFSKTGLDEDIFTPLGRDSMPVMADLDDHAFHAGVAGPAVTYDNLTLVYSPVQVKPAPTSWKVLWDKKYDGKIAIATSLPPLPIRPACSTSSRPCASSSAPISS